MEYKNAIYIGRFQPFHNGHLAVVEKGLEIAEKLTIIVGSANAAPNTKNPWTFDQRKDLITRTIEGSGSSLSRINIIPVRDYFYNENTWISEVQSQTDRLGVNDTETALLGNYKDGSSYYLNYFPQWDFIPAYGKILSGSDIRKILFSQVGTPNWEGKVTPTPNLDELMNFLKPNAFNWIKRWVDTPQYMELIQEYRHLKDYKSKWSDVPFPVIFSTTDAVVICSGHVLVVRRKFAPGKNLLALPGGFLKPTETILQGTLRELKEETGIKVDKIILESSVVETKVFDHPDRSSRGRTITHASLIKLKDGKLPEVRANDDAAEAFWLPLMDVAKLETQAYEDHFQIITWAINRG